MNFSLDEKRLNKLFPFFLLISRKCIIENCGKSIKKLCHIEIGKLLFDNFNIVRPKIQSSEILNFDFLLQLQNQLSILSHVAQTDVQLRGQFEIYDDDHIIFLGTPWFDSMEKIRDRKMFLSDFAIHDSFIDLLHIIQAKEIANSDFKSLLKSYNEQTSRLISREDELLNTSNRLAQLIENLESGVLVEDENRNILLVNDQFIHIFGLPYHAHEMIGMNCADFVEKCKILFLQPDEFACEVENLQRSRQKQLDKVLEMKDGRILSRDFIPVFIRDEYKGHLWKYTDVTETKLFERKLESQKKFYEQILAEIPADIAVVDTEHRYRYVNPTAIKDAAVRSWIIGKTNKEYVSFRNKDNGIGQLRTIAFDEVVKTGLQKEWEEKTVTKDGEVKYHLRRFSPVYDEHHNLEFLIGYGVDITERKKIEQQIKLSEAKYKSIFDYSLALICTHDAEGVLLEVNDSVLENLGYSYPEIIGKPLKNVISLKYREEFERNYLRNILESGKAEGIMVARHKNGRNVYLLFQNFLLNKDSENPYIIGFAQNITDRIYAERALKYSEEKYKSILANMNLGLIEMNDEKRIIYSNKRFCDMCGYGEEELIDQQFDSLFLNAEDQQTGKQKPFNDTGAFEMKTRNKKGEQKWWLVSEGSSVDENSNTIGTIVIFLDITMQKDLENELILSKYKTELSAKSKEIFLANMSHEIRTPMNAILGIGRLLQRTKLDQQQALYLNTIHNAANNLLVILNDLLDFSKIEAGKLTLESVGFKLDDLVSNAVQVLKHKVEDKGLLIRHFVSPEINPVLIGDPYRVNQVFLNLLGNSIKFTETGSINIECTLIKDEPGNQTVQFRIRDTGIGMNKEFVAHLFDKFSQEDASVTRKFGGTGLGMSISKQLIELMDGNIMVESQKNVGTTVIFFVKFKKGTKADLPQDETQKIDSHILNGIKILLVEDNEMNRLLANTLLSQYGAKVAEAENGRIAINMLENGHVFDVIMMDLQMPVMGGFDTTVYIRKNLDANIPIIALTANAFKEEQQRCLDHGMNDFISKPFDEVKLIKMIAEWTGRSAEDAEFVAGHVESEEKLFDLSNLITISRGDKKFMFKMLNLFVTTVPATVQSMREAFAEGNLTTVAELAHRIKPSIQNLGVLSINDEIKALESLSRIQLDKEYVLEQIERISSVLNKVITALQQKALEYESPE